MWPSRRARAPPTTWHSPGVDVVPCPADKHAFDLLGVGAREDSYTSLLAAACTASHALAQALAERAGHRHAPVSKWKAVARTAASHDFDDRTVRSIPDLVLVTEDGTGMVLVENKIFSGEGQDQTLRYTEAVPQLAERFAIPEPADGQLGLLYLTLNGDRPLDPRWKSLAWPMLVGEIAALLKAGEFVDPTLRRLLEELCERIQWRTELEAPPDATLAAFLGNTREAMEWSSIVDLPVRFAACFPEPQFDGFRTWRGTTANRGTGRVPLVQIFRDTWRSEEEITEDSPDDREVGWRAFNVHFELQWRSSTDPLALELHHETNPYRRKSDVQDHPKLTAGIQERRRAFARLLDARLSELPGWKRPRRIWNNMLHYRPEFDPLIVSRLIGDLRTQIRTAIGDVAPIVDDVIRDLELKGPDAF